MEQIIDRISPTSQKILIVDDEIDTCSLLEILFQSKGYATKVALNGIDALNIINGEPVDLVLLDITMPIMDGWEVYEHIRACSTTPVLFLSAASSGENASRALLIGAEDYIRKPFHSGELLQRIQVLFERRSEIHRRLDSTFSQYLKANKPKVSVIIPTLNEAENLPLLLPYMPEEWVHEFILVDGRSSDNTVEVAKKLLPSIKVVLEQTPGKGAAIQAGYEAAHGDILVVIDADGSNDPREIPRFIQALIQGADFVKGSRFACGGGTSDMPRLRQLGNDAFVKIVNALFGTHFSDLCYGYHAFWRYSLDHLDLSNINGFEIDTAIYLRAVSQKLKIVEVPSFEGYRFYGVGKLRTFPDGWRVLRTIFAEYFQHMQKRGDTLHKGFRGRRPVNQSAMIHYSAEGLVQ
jgi:CheY-like chemotaxis protein